VPAEGEAPMDPVGSPRSPHLPRSVRSHFMFRAPPPWAAALLLIPLSLLLVLVIWWPGAGWTEFMEGCVLVFLLPALLATLLTTPLAAALGGRLEWRRASLLALSVLLLELPLAAVGRLAFDSFPRYLPVLAMLPLFLQGPATWFRHMTLFGVSRASHTASILPTLIQPALAVVGVLALYGATPALLAAGFVFVLWGFLCSALLLRAADRPLRREFHTSGVALIRPMLDHVNGRDPSATRELEAFFSRFSIPANLSVRLLTFPGPDRVRASIALPTVHPGPFASLGASDLPRKVADRLGPGAGTVFVPHTPCDHDLDLPSRAEMDRVSQACRELLDELGPDGSVGPVRASPLVSPYSESLARAQLLGETALVLVTQAPDPTDDIAFAVADRAVREASGRTGLAVALIDAHNSYIKDRGDISYGTPTAERLIRDVTAAVEAAHKAAQLSSLEVGTSTRTHFRIGSDGIGPLGIRVLVIRTAGSTSAYVLIDGNNLLVGLRDPMVRSLETLVDHAEVLTTDNHVVHEVDGGINPVGERAPLERLTKESMELLREAIADLAPVQVRTARRELPSVPVLAPSFTARLLTSLSDTMAIFSNALLSTFFLLLAISTAVLLVKP
jgi:putative membrane protein